MSFYLFKHNQTYLFECLNESNDSSETQLLFLPHGNVFSFTGQHTLILQQLKTFNGPLLKFLVCSFHKTFHNVGFLFQFGTQTLLFQMPEYPKERKFWFLTSYNYNPKAANISSGK